MHYVLIITNKVALPSSDFERPNGAKLECNMACYPTNYLSTLT